MTNNVNVTNRGFEYLAAYFGGNNPGGGSWPQPKYIGWGGANGYNASAVNLPATAPSNTIGTGQWSDIAPYQEFSEARVSGTGGFTTATVSSGTVGWYLNGTLTASTGESVGESFLAMASSKPATFTVNGNVTTSQTSLTVNTSGALAGQYYQMNNEVIVIASTAASNVWNITRAQNGSTAGTAKTNDVLTYGNPPGGNSDAGGNPSNGDMFAHAGFQALTLNSGDSIAFTWVFNVTS